jgi:hypothetical protein
MQAVLAALLVRALASAVCADDASAPAPPAGKLDVAEPVYDAGKVERGTTIRHTFVLKNVGAAELSVDAKPG